MPDWSREIAALVGAVGLDPAREAEILEELGQHLNDRYEELLAAGASEDEARRAAIGELEGGKLSASLSAVLPPARPAPVLGRAESGGFVAGLWRDLRHGARLLRLDPGFTVAAVLSLALGLGANTAIFQLLDAVRLRTLPVREPGRLAEVLIVQNSRGRTGHFTARHSELTSAIWERLREEQGAFSKIAAWSSERLNLAPGGEARWADAMWVSGDFFGVLGVAPALGRLISPSDDRRGCGSVGAVISNSFWQREFGGRRSALGTRITLEGHPFEIIGVTPPGFFGVDVGRSFDVALPTCSEPVIYAEEPRTGNRQSWWLAVVGRLKPGWTMERASAQLAVISPGIFEATAPPDYDAITRKQYLGFKLGAHPAATGWSSLRSRYATPLSLLLGISGLVLLIACANLANLMVARSGARQREIAVRLALGASRGRLIRQLLAESLVLALLGAACGAALAQALTRVLVSSLTTGNAALFIDLHPDGRVLGFMVGLTSLTCLLFGLMPALQATRAEPLEALKAGGRGIAGSRARFGIRRALVVSQVSLSLVLLVGALLFVRTFRNLSSVNAGFGQDHILISEIDFTTLNLPREARTAYKRELLERLRAIPGVLSAASARIAPVSGEGWNDDVFVRGTPAANHLTNFNRVSPGYFRTLQTPFLAGRDFDGNDTKSSPAVAIVTETFARRFFSGSNPVGRAFLKKGQDDGRDVVYQVVGLVRDTKYQDLREDFTPIVFLVEAQDGTPGPWTRVMIRSDQPLAEILSAVKRAVADASPQIVLNFRVLKTTIRDGLLRERLMAILSGFFGALAAVLAMIGLYGVMSFMVVRRKNEIGVRMALGASRRDILGMVLREAAALLGIGLVAGALLAVGAATTARSLLFGLQPGDPATLALAAVGLTIVGLGASLLPARRAASIDPMQALREE